MSAAATARGQLFVIAAPSGAGKTTLVHALLESLPNLTFSISHTTRQPRKREVDGVDYFFVDEATFKRMVDNEEFLEHALVFDNWYGTTKSEVERLRGEGRSVVLEIDWQGARQVRHAVADARSIFIVPPTVAELERRLRDRGTDSEATIARRLEDSVSDLGHWEEFDYIIINDDLETARRALVDVVTGAGEPFRSDRPETRAAVARILAGGG